MSFWVALDPVTAESGALEFVCGSHKWGHFFQPEPFAKGGTSYERNPAYVDISDIDANRGRYGFATPEGRLPCLVLEEWWHRKDVSPVSTR